MLTVTQALERVHAVIPTMGTEQVPLADAFGRVLAVDVISERDVPPWDNSAMDGYALIAADTASGQAELKLLELIGAGDYPTQTVVRGAASQIMTGAPMPQGADAVVMVEKTNGASEGSVQIHQLAAAGQNVRRRGADIAVGQTVLTAGMVLTPAQVGLISSLGRPTVQVVRRPVVAILSTGDEVVQPGIPLEPGQIYSSNNIALVGLVRAAGCVALDLGTAEDTLPAITKAISSAMDQADVVVTTGGVSMGVFDYVRDAYANLGADIDFWKVAMKPGKPLAYGIVQRDGRTIPLFGLPGNPVSCLVNFLQFVRPVLAASQRRPARFLPVIEAVATEPVTVRTGRAKLIRVVLERTDSGFAFCRTGTQSSGVLTSMARAHGLLLVGPDSTGVPEGQVGRVQVIDASFLNGQHPEYGW